MQKFGVRVMLDQPQRVLRAFGAVLRTAGAVGPLIVCHQLEPRRKVVRIRGKLLFEPGGIGLLQFENAAQRLHVPWAEQTRGWGHGLRLRETRRSGQRRQYCDTDGHAPSVARRSYSNPSVSRQLAAARSLTVAVRCWDVRPHCASTEHALRASTEHALRASTAHALRASTAHALQASTEPR